MKLLGILSPWKIAAGAVAASIVFASVAHWRAHRAQDQLSWARQALAIERATSAALHGRMAALRDDRGARDGIQRLDNDGLRAAAREWLLEPDDRDR